MIKDSDDILKKIQQEHEKIIIEYEKFKKTFHESYPLEIVRWTYLMDQIAVMRARLSDHSESIKDLALSVFNLSQR